METGSLRLGEALTTSWATIRRYPGLAIGGFLLYYGISLAAGLIPFVGSLASIFLTPPLLGGMITLTLKMVDGRDPRLEDLFLGFRAYWKWMGIYWLYTAICLAAIAPLLIVVFAGWFVWGPGSPLEHHAGSAGSDLAEPAVIAVACLLGLAFLALWVWVTVTFWFALYVGVEMRGVVDAFRRAAALTRGRRLHLLGIMIVLGLVAISGVVALVVGVFLTLLLSHFAMAALYRQLSPYAAPPLEPQPWPAQPQQWPPPGPGEWPQPPPGQRPGPASE